MKTTKYLWTTITPGSMSERIMPCQLHEDSLFHVYFLQEERDRIEAELKETGESTAEDKFGRKCTFKKLSY